VTRWPLAWLPCAAALLFSSCGGGDRASGVSPRRATLESIVDNVYLPMLADFERAADELATQAQAFCAEPDERGLTRVRDAWQSARTPWEQSQVMAFGPHTLPPWRLASSIDFWPAREDDVEAVLAGDQTLTGDAALAQVGASGKGFAAIEYLLYGPDGDLPADAFAAGDAGERRCQYLVALGADLHDRARELRKAWRDDFAPELLLDAESERYADLNEAFGTVVNSLAFTVELVRDTKLGKPLGARSGGDAQPELSESRFSGRGVQDAIDNLRGVEDVFTGGYGDEPARGIAELLRERGHDSDAQFAMHMDNAVAALEAIDAPLDEAVVDDRRKVTAAMDALRELLVFLQVDLTQALSVTVTFGGADGD
jgi:predicted lipoprotein